MPSSFYFNVSLLIILLTSTSVFSLSLLAQQPIPSPPATERPATKEREPSEMFGGIREEMPLFSKCEEEPDYASRKKCSDSLLIAFIYDNLRYPHKAWRDSIEGMAVITFFVEKDGTVSEAKIIRDPGTGTGREALRLVNLMNKRQGRWIPGKQAGKPVRIQFNLPVKFKMADHEYRPPPPPPSSKTGIVQLATTLKEPPLFPGCEDLGSYPEKQQCATAKFEAFLQGNLRYPERALERGVEGTVLVSFIVEKDGQINNVKILHDLGAGTGKEALRLVTLLNKKGLKFSPQRSSGRSVRVMYTLPVQFQFQ